MEIHATNTNDLAPRVYEYLQLHGIEESSRNGTVLRAPEPVSVVLRNPRERVNFCPARDANPFFHLWESIAMLADFNSAELLGWFAKNMFSFSDDGERYNAFYGTRARTTYGDQLLRAARELEQRPNSRQAVVSLWDPACDNLERVTKDRACNLMMLFSIRDNALEMTTFNRSNDAIWGGVTGANIVHLSFFQEWVACYLGLPMGRWWHTSNNLHVYLSNPKWSVLPKLNLDDTRTYPGTGPWLFHGRGDAFRFDTLARQACLEAARAARGGWCSLPDDDGFLSTVAGPALAAWFHHKAGRRADAIEAAQLICARDWRHACVAWLLRRYESTEVAQ